MHPSIKAEFIPPPPLEPKKEMDRNELCWCRSGKKWKKCHRERHLKPEIQISMLVNGHLEKDKKGACLYPEALGGGCTNQIIKAHTIQRSGGLGAIAENGHVISVKRGFEKIIKNEGKIVPEHLGVRKASTFMGFCSFHDNALFEAIETGSLTLNHEAAFLLSFRAISYEYLLKQNAIDLIEIQREIDRGKDFEAQVDIQQYLYSYKVGLIRGMQDLKDWKAEYDRMFLSRDYQSMPYYAVEFDGVLPFVCCGGFHAEVDFNGHQLQIISRGTAPVEHVCLNISVVGSKSYLVFGWYGSSHGPAEEFVKSFKSIDNKDKANSCLLMAVEQLENTYFNPSWWNSLNGSDKEHLIQRMQSGAGRNSMRPKDTYLNLRQIIQTLPAVAEAGTL